MKRSSQGGYNWISGLALCMTEVPLRPGEIPRASGGLRIWYQSRQWVLKDCSWSNDLVRFIQSWVGEMAQQTKVPVTKVIYWLRNFPLICTTVLWQVSLPIDKQTDLKNQVRGKSSWVVSMKISQWKPLCIINMGLLNTKFWERALSNLG